MATSTPNIGLVKPGLGEYTGSWNIPINNNFDIIDTQVGALNTSTAAAAGTQASLNDRLNVSLNSDGSLKDVPEIAKARNSTVYGAAEGTSLFVLDDRIEKGDRESFDARAGSSSLLDAVAFASDDFVPNSVNSAPTNFLTFTGANVKVDGSVTPIIANINGYKRVVRRLMQTTISGGAGTYYIYLDKNLSGEVIIDRTGAGNNTGATGLGTGGYLTKFTDITQNFITSNVQPGDILEITTAGSLNKYQYVVDSVVGANELAIKGWFEVAQATLSYKITDPLAPSLSFTSTAHSKRFERVDGKIFIGNCVFDGANVTGVQQYAAKGRYEEWFSVSLVGGYYLITASHSLGYLPTKLQIFASQANDFSQPLEPIAIAQISGAGVSDDRAAIADMTDTTIRIKNPTSGVFYKDFSGISQSTGFLFVVAER